MYDIILYSLSKAVSLGEARSPPSILRNGGGVVLDYTNGSICKGETRWTSTLVLTCDRDVARVSEKVITHVLTFAMNSI